MRLVSRNIWRVLRGHNTYRHCLHYLLSVLKNCPLIPPSSLNWHLRLLLQKAKNALWWGGGDCPNQLTLIFILWYLYLSVVIQTCKMVFFLFTKKRSKVNLTNVLLTRRSFGFETNIKLGKLVWVKQAKSKCVVTTSCRLGTGLKKTLDKIKRENWFGKKTAFVELPTIVKG